jgi:uncharacterized protein YdaU (DUF1376 family)
MTLEERGAYITLLAWSWEHGPVPNDLKRIAAILGTHVGSARRLWAEVCKRWTLNDKNEWRNRRLEKIRESQAAFSAVQSEKGKAGAAKRWEGHGPANGHCLAGGMAGAMAGPMAGVKPDGWPTDSSPISDLRSLDQDRKTIAPKDTAPTRALMTEFDRLHRERVGHAAVFNGAKDGRLLKALCGSHGEALVRELIAAYFASTDEFIRGAGYTIGVFHSQFAKLLAQRKAPSRSPVPGVHETRRFLERTTS